MSGARPAVFLDRDGTLIVEREYLADPAGVELLPGATAALRRLRAAGFAIVLISNQSGIARGLFGVPDFEAVQARLASVLRTQGLELDAVYYCPHHPEHGPPCECRKPATGLFRKAAAELVLDLPSSAFVGDRLSDVEPALTLGGRALLVRTGYGAALAATAPAWVEVVNDLEEAADRILAGPTPAAP